MNAMTEDLAGLIDDYLRVRRALGYKLDGVENTLGHFVAYLDVFVFEFIGRDRAFGLIADIDEDNLGFDFEDSALHDGPLVERAECARDQFR